MIGPLFAALVAAFPGAFAWWTGRRLARRTDDPALPELLMARQQRVVTVVAGAAAVLLVMITAQAGWGLLLLALLLIVGGYPLRRTLLGETASLPVYLWRTLKSLLGGMGFWILLAWTPMIVLDIEPRWWPLSLALVPILLLWEHFHPRIWLRLHDAEPLASAELAPRIAAIVERAGIAPPALYRIGAPGTRFVNALALPSVKRPAVGLGNALLELLEPDEAAAIYAHELAHIEHYAPRVIRRLQMVNRLLMIAAVAVPLLIRWLAPNAAHWVTWIFPFAVLAVLVQRGKRSQQHETESDLRAAALCGDPEAVARALIKLHVHAWIPRRWPIDFERNATHPSLARRVQALRGQGPQAISSSGTPTVLPTAREGSVVAFEDARAWWFDGVPRDTAPVFDALRDQASSTRSVAWADLVELRVTTSGEGRALQATHRNGDRWSVPLAASQVAAVQKALDVVDVRLHRDLGKRPWPGARVAAAAVLLAAMLASLLGVVVVPAALVLWRPSSLALSALGAMAAGRAVLALLLGEESAVLTQPPVPVALLMVAGVLALLLAWRQARPAREGASRELRLTLGVLVGLAALLVLATVAAAWGMAAAGIHLAVPMAPALSATLLGIAAVLALAPGPRMRWWSAAAAAGALAAAVPLVTRLGPALLDDDLTPADARAEETGRLGLGESVMGLRLSPGGTRFLVQPFDARAYDRGGRRAAGSRHVLGDSAGIRREIEALQAAFVDDTRILALYAADTILELRLESADSAAVFWSAAIPNLYDATLTVSPGDGSWSVAGEEIGTDSLVVAGGNAASGETRLRRFAPLDSVGGMGFLVFGAGERVLIPAYGGAPRSSLPFLFALLSPGSLAVDLWEVDSSGHRPVASLDGVPQCGVPDEGEVLCLVSSLRRASVWTVSPAAAAVATRRARFPRLVSAWVGPGESVTALRGTDRITHMDVAAGQRVEVELPNTAGAGGVYEARLAAGRLVTLRADSSGASVVFYRVTPR